MRTAIEVFQQNDGDVTRAYYLELSSLGAAGHIAVCLFRAQKRSAAAKRYHGKFRRSAYDVKNWSMQELCSALEKHGAKLGIVWGWKADPQVKFGGTDSWVLYIDLPQGQASFHSPVRLSGPEYAGEWDGVVGGSVDRIIQFTDAVAAGAVA